MKKLLLAVVFLTALNSFGTDKKNEATAILVDTNNVPQDYLIEGKYETKKGLFNNLEITKWADDYIIEAYVNYGSGVEVTYNVRQINGNLFKGEGLLKAKYSGGTTCNYKTDITIKAYTNGIYIKSLLPDSIPSEIVGTTCKSVSYSEAIEKFPYVLK